MRSMAGYYTSLIKRVFADILQEHSVDLDTEVVCWHEDTGELGLPGNDYALLRGPEKLLTCRYMESTAQVFTVAPKSYRGSLREVLGLDPSSIEEAGIFHATMNAVFKHLGLVHKTMHCRGCEPEFCGEHLAKQLVAKHGGTTRIMHIGYHPGHVEKLAEIYRDNLVVTDLSRDIVWRRRHGRLVVDGELNKYYILFSSIVLVTASSIVNNTVWELLSLAHLYRKKVIVYGVSGSATVYILRNRVFRDIDYYCPYGR